MGMKFKIDGWMSPYEYRALSTMFAELAAGAEKERAGRNAIDKVSAPEDFGLGGINREASPVWSNAPAAETPNTAPETAEARGHTAEQNATRKRGEPSPGKKRRTAAEVAEDEAFASLLQSIFFINIHNQWIFYLLKNIYYY